jgi:hypothetical protein
VKAPRPCIEVGCPELAVRGARCLRHALAWREQRWKDGSTGQRGSRPGWARRRKQVLVRDRHHCRLCGVQNRLEVAHINGDATDDRMWNLLTLCHDDHTAFDGRRGVKDEKPLPNQLTIDECIAIAQEEDLVRLAANPKMTVQQVVAERLARETSAGLEDEGG